MPDAVLTGLQYYGAAAATLAALIVSLDLGRRWTGAAMVIFVTSSCALIAWGFVQPRECRHRLAECRPARDQRHWRLAVI